MVLEDAKPRYIVTVIYTEYEQSSHFFVGREAAEKFAKDKAKQSEVHFGELLEVTPTPDTTKLDNWKRCCTAANRLADLVCIMYHPKDDKARKTWPTATWAELIARELNLDVPETL